MEYIVVRTSAILSDTKPCKEAYRGVCNYWEIRTLTDEKEFDTKFSDREGAWRSKGKNHGFTKDGYIKRQMEDIEVWYIELEELKDFVDFCIKYDALVTYYENRFEKLIIEIYDGYRE